MTVALRTAITLVFLGFVSAPAFATDGVTPQEEPLIRPAGDVDLSEFVWKKRPVVVFADDPADPAFVEQIELLNAGLDRLKERDVVVLTDTDPSVLSPVRRKLRPRGFMLAIISKEGRVQLRKPFPWDVREISRTIDKMTIRQREIREAKETE